MHLLYLHILLLLIQEMLGWPARGGTGPAEWKWQMADGGWQMADGNPESFRGAWRQMAELSSWRR
jgi:hypothetical protein